MTPEFMVLRAQFEVAFGHFRNFIISTIDSTAALMNMNVLATNSPADLIRLLSQIEILTTNSASRYLRRLNHNRSLASQSRILANVSRIDAYSYNLHQLFDQHIEAIIAAEPNGNIRDSMQRLEQWIVVDHETAANDTQRNILTSLRQRTLLHCYKALLAGGIQSQLINQLSQSLNINHQLKLSFNYSDSELSTYSETENIDNARAILNLNGNQQLSAAERERMRRLNNILADTQSNTQLTEQDMLVLNQLNPGEGSSCTLNFTILVSEAALMRIATSSEVHPLGLEESLRRLFSGILFVKRDAAAGYYPFYITLMHELNHALNSVQGLVATHIAIDTLLDAEWGAGRMGSTNEKTEEFKVTLFNPTSEYFITHEMGITVFRLPYVIFTLPLGLMRVDSSLGQNASCVTPLAEYMRTHGYLPGSEQGNTCAMM